jgi:hypothetical protein
MKRNHTRLCASAAIAAALALPLTPLMAQVVPAPTTVEPAPILTIPTTPPPAPAQPTIVLPTELPQAAPPPASVTTAERATAPTPPRAERATPVSTPTRREGAASRASPPAAGVRADAPADPAPAPVVGEIEPLAAETVPETAAESVAPLAANAPVATEAPAENDKALQFGGAVLAAIAAFVLAIWGFIAIGRRRPVDRKAAAMIERPVVARREPIVPPAMAEPVPAIAPSVSPLRNATPAPSMMHTGAAVPLPRTVPATFEERDALIKRMVAAKPDRANPFTSPIQRHKRAKLILQSLGRDFGDAEPWIDLSQYPQNWPELAARKHAAA